MTSPPSPSPLPAATVRAGVTATSVSFVGQGLIASTFAARIPQLRAHLALEPSQLGLVLLAIAAGSLLSLPSAGPLISRIGARRTVTVMSLVYGGALLLDGIGYRVGLPLLIVALVLQGVGQGAWDVGMNVHGAQVEQHLGRPILPRFHAGFSIGTVAGALLGAAAVAAGVSVTTHFAVVGAVVALGCAWSARRFLPAEPPGAPGGSGEAGRTSGAGRGLERWREPRTLLIGLFVLAFAFSEGTGNDWISLAVIDGYGASAAVGTLAFAAFLAAMTTGRWFGPSWLLRVGRLGVLRVLAVVALVGLLLFVSGAAVLPLAFLGVVLWGFGTSLGFPVGMSAGADDPSLAPGRVSVIASIGYLAFLGGPPFVGFLGNHLGVLHALSVAGALLAIAFVVAPSLRPPRPAGDAAGSADERRDRVT